MQKTVSTSCNNIAYVDQGTGDQCVIFIHGNSSCKEVFAKQLDSSLADHYRLVTFDLPGHGNSDRAANPEECYRIASYAKLLRELVVTLELGSPVLVGWSLGGHIALEAAAQGLECKGIVLSGTPPFGPGTQGADAAFYPTEHMALTGQENFTEEEADIYASEMLGGKEWVTPYILQQVRDCDGRSRQIMFSDWGNVESGYPAIPFIESWTKPIAVLQGEQDAFVQMDHLQNLSWRNLWRNEIQIVTDCGHAPFWESSDDYNNLLVEFLKSIQHKSL